MKNFVGCLLAISLLGETGNCIAILSEDDDSYYGLKLFPGGNGNIILSKKEVLLAIEDEELQVADESIPEDVFNILNEAYLNNQSKLEIQDLEE